MRRRRISSTSRKPSRRDQRHPGALALEQRVGRDRRAVHDLRDVVDAERRRARCALQAVGDALAVVVGRRQHLGAQHAALRVQEHEVGEGAADVDADPCWPCRCVRRQAVSAMPSSSAALPPRMRSFSPALRNVQCLRT